MGHTQGGVRRDTWQAGVLFAALTMAMTYPLSIAANRTVPADDPDMHLFLWTLAWDVRAFVHQPFAIFDANIFYPNHGTLAYSENLIGSAFIAAPVLWLTNNPVLALNVVSLVACALCGLGAYVLARRLGVGVEGAVVAGIIFAFSPPRFLRFSQLHMAPVQWIPFTLAAFHAYLDEGRRRDLLLATGLTTLQILSTGHGGMFLLVALVVLLTYRIALGEPIRAAQRLRDFGIAGVLLVVPAVLILVPYLEAQEEVGLRRALSGWETPVEAFVASPTHVHVYLQRLLGLTEVNRTAGAYLFPGIGTLLLALAGVVAGTTALIRRTTRDSDSTPRPIRTGTRRVLLGSAAAGIVLSVIAPLLKAGDGLAVEPSGERLVAHTGYLTVLRSGSYVFGIDADEPCLVVVDGVRVLERTQSEGGRSIGRPVTLATGPHRVLVQRVAHDRQRVSDWMWAREGDPYRPVPAWMQSRHQAGIAMTMAALIVRRARSASVVVFVLALIGSAVRYVVQRRATWPLWRERLRTNAAVCYLVLALVALLLSIGPPLGIWPLVYRLPGFSFIRSNSRFMVLAVLAIAVLGGIGVDALIRRFRSGTRRAATIGVALLLLGECSMLPYRGVPYRFNVPDADRWLATLQRPIVVAEVPVERLERYHSTYMVHSMAHWQKTVHGFSGIRPALHEVLYEELRRFPTDEGVRHLARLGVTHLVVHTSMMPPEDLRALELRLPAFERWLKLEYRDADSRVYALTSGQPEQRTQQP